jgi:hypothetical protein
MVRLITNPQWEEQTSHIKRGVCAVFIIQRRKERMNETRPREERACDA